MGVRELVEVHTSNVLRFLRTWREGWESGAGRGGRDKGKVGRRKAPRSAHTSKRPGLEDEPSPGKARLSNRVCRF